jgi:hypothetical protein
MALSRPLLLLAGAGLWTASVANHIFRWRDHPRLQGGNLYEVTLILYRDCAGLTLGATQTVAANSPCGSASATVTLESVEEISPLCSSMLSNSSCNGGPLPGAQAYTYSGLVTLSPCDSWTLSWVMCCRNTAIVNLTDPVAMDLYVEATMNNAIAACPRSPVFTYQPIAYFCQGAAGDLQLQRLLAGQAIRSVTSSSPRWKRVERRGLTNRATRSMSPSRASPSTR